MLAKGTAGEVGEGVTGKAQNEGQQQVGPVDAGGFHAEEPRKRISDGNTAEQARHDLGKLYFPSLEDRVAEKDQCFQDKQERHMRRTVIVPLHGEHSADCAETH